MSTLPPSRARLRPIDLAPEVIGPPASGVFGPGQLDQLAAHVDRYGFATLRGVFDEAELLGAEAELVELQRRLAEGTLPGRHGSATSVALDEPGATIGGRPFAHYVYFATEASAAADALVHHPALVGVAERVLGPQAWLLDYEIFGVVYQDARPDPGSGYSRIGWHTDHQSGPDLAMWPGMAFTVHFDPTSPANGSCPAATAGTPRGSPWASSGSPARSPSTRSGATCSSTTPTSGTRRPGGRPTATRRSAGTSGAAGTAAPGSSRATAPTTS